MTTQTKPAWTPGPWTHEDGEIIAQGAVIAQVMGADDFPCCEEDIDAECKANASLISKCPEMVELLRGIATTLDMLAPCPEEVLDKIKDQCDRLLADLEAV